MKISGFKRITSDDVQSEYKQLADKLANSLNPFAEEVVTAINGRLDVVNLNQKYKEFSFLVDSSGLPTQDLVFKSDIVGRVKGIDIQYLENVTNVNTYPTAAPFITWSESGGLITIKHVTGLQTLNKWKMRVLVKGE